MAPDIAASRKSPSQGMQLFLIIWIGQLISLLGSRLTGFALSVWVFQTTGSVTQLTLISFFAVLPLLVFSPLAGALVDRWQLRWTLILSDLGAALCTLSFITLLWFNQLAIWHIYLIVSLVSLFTAFQFPAFGTATTLIVPKHQLGRASGMVPLAQGLAQLLAPLLAGLLVGWVGLVGIIMIDFFTCLFALAILLLIPIPRRATYDAVTAERRPLWRDLTFGWQYIVARPGLLSLLLFFAVSNFMTCAVVVLANPLILSFATPALLGAILSTAGLGVLAGSTLMSIWGGPQRRVQAVFGSMALAAIAMVVGGLTTSPVLIGLAAFCFTFTTPIVAGCSQAIWQRKVPAAVQGRVFAARSMIATSSLPLAYLVVGPLADYIFEPLLARNGALAGSVGRLIGVGTGRGIGFMLIVFGILLLVLVVAGYRYPRLRLLEDEIPDSIPDTPPTAATLGQPIPVQANQG